MVADEVPRRPEPRQRPAWGEDFKASKDHKAHRAHVELLFTVETQVLVPVDGGHVGQSAW